MPAENAAPQGRQSPEDTRKAAVFPGTVGVIGGGRMGAGIAQVFAATGAEVVVVESDPEAAAAATERVLSGLRRAQEKGKLDEAPDAVLARVRMVTDVAELPASAELVVEAVPERLDLKVAVLAAAERVVGDATVLASNTSSLSIGELAAALRVPSRLLGMHFFNPVPASSLVEVVVGPHTAPEVGSTVSEWVRALARVS